MFHLIEDVRKETWYETHRNGFISHGMNTRARIKRTSGFRPWFWPRVERCSEEEYYPETTH